VVECGLNNQKIIMRKSCDQYRLPNGVIVNCTSAEIEKEILKDGGVLYNGYDYQKQYWVYKGERDTRTLEELRQAMA
jgi:hypothetical protein